MKYFYLIILTLFSVTQSDAAGADSPVDDGLTAAVAAAKKSVKTPGRRFSTASDAGSCTGSFTGSYAGSHGGASTIMAKHKIYELELTDETDVEKEYDKLLAAYKELLALSSGTDARLSQFVGVVEKILPSGIDRSSADEDSLVSLRTALRQLMDMYKTLRKSYDVTTGKTTVLESTVAELKAGQEALKATLATMAPRPTEFVGTDMSPERLTAAAAVATESSEIVKGLRVRVAELEVIAAERDRLVAENAALKAAATESSEIVKGLRVRVAELEAVAAKHVSNVASSDVRQPLLDKSGSSGKSRYKSVDDANKKDPSCPCAMM